MGTEFQFEEDEKCSGDVWWRQSHNSMNIFNDTELYTWKWSKWQILYYGYFPQLKNLKNYPDKQHCPTKMHWINILIAMRKHSEWMSSLCYRHIIFVVILTAKDHSKGGKIHETDLTSRNTVPLWWQSAHMRKTISGKRGKSSILGSLVLRVPLWAKDMQCQLLHVWHNELGVIVFKEKKILAKSSNHRKVFWMCTAPGEENKTLLLKTKAKTNIYVADTLYILSCWLCISAVWWSLDYNYPKEP